MPFTSDAALKALTNRFLDHTLPKEDWTHAAHFAVAICLLADPERDAFAELPDLIRAYNLATGVTNTDTDGYHETITLASLAAARHYVVSAPPGDPRHAILARLLLAPYGRADWMLTYWSRDRLFSVRARREWVEPDLEPLPFDGPGH